MFGYSPNILGGLHPLISTSGATFTGSMEGTKKVEHDLDGGSTGATEYTYTLQFDASKSSSLYTTDGGLQVSALQILACIKI